MGILKQKFRSIKKFPTWIYWFPARLLWLALRVFYRFRIVDPHDHIHNTAGLVTVTWHNRLMFFAVAFPKHVRRHTMAVVSASRDGQYIADFISTLGIASLRGSSSKRGLHAQLAAVRAMREGYHVSFTPDGPRGPRYQMKNGPVQLASISGRPIIPISINASRYWSIRSWDGFQIPKPFCRITLELGASLAVPPELNAEEMERERQRVEAALIAITRD